MLDTSVQLAQREDGPPWWFDPIYVIGCLELSDGCTERGRLLLYLIGRFVGWEILRHLGKRSVGTFFSWLFSSGEPAVVFLCPSCRLLVAPTGSGRWCCPQVYPKTQAFFSLSLPPAVATEGAISNTGRTNTELYLAKWISAARDNVIGPKLGDQSSGGAQRRSIGPFRRVAFPKRLLERRRKAIAGRSYPVRTGGGRIPSGF